MISGERWKITLYQVSCYTKVLPILYPYHWKTKVSSNIKHLIRKRNKRDDLRVRRWRLSIDNGQLSNLRVSNAALALSVLGWFFLKEFSNSVKALKNLTWLKKPSASLKLRSYSSVRFLRVLTSSFFSVYACWMMLYKRVILDLRTGKS